MFGIFYLTIKFIAEVYGSIKDTIENVEASKIKHPILNAYQDRNGAWHDSVTGEMIFIGSNVKTGRRVVRNSKGKIIMDYSKILEDINDEKYDEEYKKTMEDLKNKINEHPKNETVYTFPINLIVRHSKFRTPFGYAKCYDYQSGHLFNIFKNNASIYDAYYYLDTETGLFVRPTDSFVNRFENSTNNKIPNQKIIEMELKYLNDKQNKYKEAKLWKLYYRTPDYFKFRDLWKEV